MQKNKLLDSLRRSFLECEVNLGFSPAFKLNKLDLSTNEPFHNCNSSNTATIIQIDADNPIVKQYKADLESLVKTFPMKGRKLSSLTDLRLGNCLNNLLPVDTNSKIQSEMLMAGIGQCCPSLKVFFSPP